LNGRPEGNSAGLRNLTVSARVNDAQLIHQLIGGAMKDNLCGKKYFPQSCKDEVRESVVDGQINVLRLCQRRFFQNRQYFAVDSSKEYLPTQVAFHVAKSTRRPLLKSRFHRVERALPTGRCLSLHPVLCLPARVPMSRTHSRPNRRIGAPYVPQAAHVMRPTTSIHVWDRRILCAFLQLRGGGRYSGRCRGDDTPHPTHGRGRGDPPLRRSTREAYCESVRHSGSLSQHRPRA